MPTKILFSSVALAGAVFLAGTIPAAHAASVFDIEYPIPELGGCADRTACKAYCDDAAHQSACEAFAKEYGLTVHTEASVPEHAPPAQPPSERKDEGAARVNAALADGGPGGCAAGASDPEEACRAFCDASSHIQECVEYGESHGLLSGEKLAQAKKVAAALAKGVALPEGCADQRSCERSCRAPSSLSQAKSCFAFGKAAGILPPNFDEARAEKIFNAIQNGSAPFSSFRDFQKCENPTDSALIQKCTEFAVQNGLLSQQEADAIRQTSGKGPGGCVGKDACESYCQDHGDECFQFAQEHHLVPPEEQARLMHAGARLEDALGRAPEAVRTCIKNAVGQDTLDAITSGMKPGSPDIGQKMQACFEAERGERQPGEQQMPPGAGLNEGNPMFHQGMPPPEGFEGSTTGNRFMPPAEGAYREGGEYRGMMPPPYPYGEGARASSSAPLGAPYYGQDGGQYPQNAPGTIYPQGSYPMYQQAPGSMPLPPQNSGTFAPPPPPDSGTFTAPPPAPDSGTVAPPPPSTSFLYSFARGAAAAILPFLRF